MNDSIQRIRPVEPLSITRKVKRKEGDGQGNSLDWRDVLEDASRQHHNQEKKQQETPQKEERTRTTNTVSSRDEDFDENAILERLTAHPEELLQSYKDPDRYTPLSEGKWIDSKG